jgi:hypothetical protein
MQPPSAFEQSQNMTDAADIDLSSVPVPPSVLGALGIAIGGIITAIGVVSFIVAYGLLKGMRWAWTLTVEFYQLLVSYLMLFHLLQEI